MALATLLSMVIFGEDLSATQLVGGAITLAAIYWGSNPD